MAKKKRRRRNPVARALQRYRHQVIENKKRRRDKRGDIGLEDYEDKNDDHN